MPVKLEILPTFMLYRQVLQVTTCSPWVRSSFGGVARSQARATRERSFIFSTLLPDNGVTNRPFAARHSRGTKPPCWRAKVTLGQDKQRQLLSKIMFAFCLSCRSATFALQHGGFVPREWLAATSLLTTSK